ncbi:hypothetical protein BN946_scf185016.g89 [Trametes cinnabarina]|uniref:Uncharacterized protein n=1 Tax=Pycnoporus cinnabarinus TaxID=5643 RepID=A0A060SHE6_PYCCI|nr:hypothetical protein BN946_scf185016.g89 [Trametes cinnabarina]
MIAEDMMEICKEPTSSQPYGLAEWQAHHAPAPRDMPVVAWDYSANKAPLYQYRRTLEQALHAQPSGSIESTDENTPPEHTEIAPSEAAVRRREGHVNHPAYLRRHMIGSDATQDSDVNEAMAEFNSRAAKTVHTSIEISKRKAEKIARARESTASSTIRRRHTSEDVQASQHRPAPKATLKSRSTEPGASALPQDDQGRRDDAMDEDQPVAGPSKRLFSLPPVPGFFDTVRTEDDGTPSCTPTPPPKHRSSGRSVSSASSSSKGKSREYSAFSESPTSLHETPLTRRHSIDPSVSYTSNHFDMDSPVQRHSSSQQSMRARDPSPVIPSPVALAAQSNHFLPDTLPPPDDSFSQAPALPPHRQSHAPSLRRSQTTSSSRLPPNMTQSPALLKPYVVPMPSQGASQALAQLRPRAPRSGAHRHWVPKEHPKAIAGFKVPFKKPSSNNADHAAAGSQRSGSPVVPDPPHISAPVRAPALPAAKPPQHQVIGMSARKPEPKDAADEVKEADSSYGDISWDFDPQALDEAMSMYD